MEQPRIQPAIAQQAGHGDAHTIVASLISERPMLHAGQWAIDPAVLNWIAGAVQPGMLTLETGAGHSTIAFLAAGADHTAISPAPEEHKRISEWCGDHGINHRASFIDARSQDVLPTLQVGELDVVLLDGWHAFPIPMLDWYFTAPKLAVGGRMIIDNTEIKPVRILADFLRAEEGRWALETQFRATAVFRKIAADVVDTGEWYTQPYSATPIMSPPERARRLFGRMLPRHHA
jgi:predicted O-methyltransferase YrrM